MGDVDLADVGGSGDTVGGNRLDLVWVRAVCGESPFLLAEELLELFVQLSCLALFQVVLLNLLDLGLVNLHGINHNRLNVVLLYTGYYLKFTAFFMMFLSKWCLMSSSLP